MRSPQKSNPLFRHRLPEIRIGVRPYESGPAEEGPLSFHLPADYRALFSISTLAYYLGASIVMDDEAFIAFDTDERLSLPGVSGIEAWAGGMLRKIFYLDCAVRYATVAGGTLNGLDVTSLLGCPADVVFHMDPAGRFLLYSGVLDVPGLPVWHMAAYLDPVPESAEALPFLMRSLAAVYTPRSYPVSERDVVSMSVRDFIGKPYVPAVPGNAGGKPIVVPSLREAGAHIWFSEGFPVDASRATVRSLHNRKPDRKSGNVALGIVCNEESMAGEVDAIVDALSDTRASIEVQWDASVSKLLNVFSRGFDIVQLVGHCDERGFKCSDGFASVRGIRGNRTPMFFFNSCTSYREAALMVDGGSICGLATLFRVLEDAAVDVCSDFYRVLGAGYPASIAASAARECSALGKEYLLIGDGSFTPFDGDPLKPFYRIDSRGGGYSLGCTMGNMDKGYVVSSWTPEGKRTVSDLGFETGPMEAEQLSAISGKLKGYCIYGRHIYESVGDAALKALEGHNKSRTRRSRG